MKEIWCASQASTAICMSMEHLASSSSTIHLGSSSSRAIDRHNPIIRDGEGRRSSASPRASEPLPFTPRLLFQRARRSFSSNQKKATEDVDVQKKKVTKQQGDQTKRRSSVKAADLIRRSCVKPVDLLTPPGSSRYLLSENGFFDLEPDSALVPVEHNKIQALQHVDPRAVTKNDYSIFRALARSASFQRSNAVQVPSAKRESSSTQSSQKQSSPSPCSTSDQVVVLKVSLHCKGCAGKVSKHISRMQGVTSFDIDFAAKKVTVTGNVTPEEVLASISKVKNAQLWSTAKPTSSQPSFIVSN